MRNKQFTQCLLGCLLWVVHASAQNAADSGLYFAGPTIFTYKNQYYLYGTGGNSDSGFSVMQSDDLRHWNREGVNSRVLNRGEVFGTRGFWAPHVFEYNGKIYMAYTANENIAFAWSVKPTGPFTQKNKQSLQSPVKQIDPFVFKDDNGSLYLYHVRLQQGNRIFVAPLKADLSGIEEKYLSECISANKERQPWENTQNVSWPVAEGPTVIKVASKYIMFYSANDFRNPDYAVGYAVADHPLGPWKKSTQNPVISNQLTMQNGSGHGDIIKDANGDLYYVFHTHFSNNKVSPRRTAIIKLNIRTDAGGMIDIRADVASFRFLVQ